MFLSISLSFGFDDKCICCNTFCSASNNSLIFNGTIDLALSSSSPLKPLPPRPILLGALPINKFFLSSSLSYFNFKKRHKITSLLLIIIINIIINVSVNIFINYNNNNYNIFLSLTDLSR